MPKNIVLLCDGTSNEISQDRTNILRLYGCLEKSDNQVVWYDPGVGTFGSENAVLRSYRRFTEMLGLLTGWGIDQNVKEAYRFLLDHYEHGPTPETCDRIFLFGFSRGAYTARMLAGFIHAFGMIDRTQLNLLDYAYRAYMRIEEAATRMPPSGDRRDPRSMFAEVQLFDRALGPVHPPIRALGLFDTVSSVLEWDGLMPRFRASAFTRVNQSVRSVRHALAIHERRVMFRPMLWAEGREYWGGPDPGTCPKPQDVAQVWFQGSHGDVGGGYPEAKAKLAKLPLLWMIDETAAMGLAYKPEVVDALVRGTDPEKHYVAPDPAAEPQESMTPPWVPLELIPSRVRPGYATQRPVFAGWHLPRFEPRVIPDGARIHASVFDSGRPDPVNLPADRTVVAATPAAAGPPPPAETAQPARQDA